MKCSFTIEIHFKKGRKEKKNERNQNGRSLQGSLNCQQFFFFSPTLLFQGSSFELLLWDMQTEQNPSVLHPVVRGGPLSS